MKRTPKKELVLWGFHPAHGNVPLKLEKYSKAADKSRRSEGWTTAAYAEGDEPTGLALEAKKVREATLLYEANFGDKAK